MHNIFSSWPNFFVCSHRSLFSNVSIFSPFHVHLSMQERKTPSHSKLNEWHTCVNAHSFKNNETNIRIPHWVVIIIWSMEDICDKVRWMFSQVGIGNSKQKTCIQEKYNENTVGDRAKHFRFSSFFNPSKQFGDNHLEDNIDSDNNERNRAVYGKSRILNSIINMTDVCWFYYITFSVFFIWSLQSKLVIWAESCLYSCQS